MERVANTVIRLKGIFQAPIRPADYDLLLEGQRVDGLVETNAGQCIGAEEKDRVGGC